MATRKPLVVVDGIVRQMGASDVLEANLKEVDYVYCDNDEIDALVIGTPVYPNGDSTVKRAQADSLSHAEVLGLVADITVAASAEARILTDGRLEATTAQWDTVTGQTGGLTPGTVYYLDPDNAGKLTVTAPSADDDVILRIGRSSSSTVLKIAISTPIVL